MQNTENTKKKNGKYRSEHRKNSSKRLKNTENTLQKTVIFPPKFGIFETFVSEYLSLRLLVSRAQLHSTTMFSAPYSTDWFSLLNAARISVPGSVFKKRAAMRAVSQFVFFN